LQPLLSKKKKILISETTKNAENEALKKIENFTANISEKSRRTRVKINRFD